MRYVESTKLGTLLPGGWDVVVWSRNYHRPGGGGQKLGLKFWALLEPGVVIQRIVVDLGSGRSYLPESPDA